MALKILGTPFLQGLNKLNLTVPLSCNTCGALSLSVVLKHSDCQSCAAAFAPSNKHL